MRIQNSLLVLALLLIPLRARASQSITPELVHNAVSDDAAARNSSIRALRETGYRGLDALIITFGKDIGEKLANKAEPKNWNLIASAIDAVAGQKDAWASGLFWHTDLEAAKQLARETHKPILSLRLLGTLDSDLSCANSRLFRTVLYSDPAIASLLRERFVLHWQMVRPVPEVTIDFGDGRVLTQTVTGNSIHYILDENGNLVDAIPGMYSPHAFIERLNRAIKSKWRSHAHIVETENLNLAWLNDLAKAGIRDFRTERANKRAGAAEASKLTVSKTAYEAVLLRAIAPDPEFLEVTAADRNWEKIAELHPENRHLSDRSIALIRSKFSKDVSDDSINAAIVELQKSIAIDTVRNRYTMEMQLHGWLSTGPNDLDAITERTYAELFATPLDDPWLGLSPDTIFNAIDGGGRSNELGSDSVD